MVGGEGKDEEGGFRFRFRFSGDGLSSLEGVPALRGSFCSPSALPRQRSVIEIKYVIRNLSYEYTNIPLFKLK